MLRIALVSATLAALALSGCTPCARIANAEASVTNGGKACNAGDSTWTSNEQQKCEANLSKCSQDDQKWMGTYADCLSRIAPCADGQGFSYALARLSCLESYSKISYACASAIK